MMTKDSNIVIAANNDETLTTPLHRPAQYFFVVVSFLFLIISVVGFVPSYQAMHNGTRKFPIHLIWAYRGKQKENEATLYARVTVNGKRAEISLSKKIDVTEWDEEACTMKGKSPESLDVNEFIDLVKGELRQRYYELRATGQEITAEAIKNKYLGIQEDQKSLLEVFRYHNDEMKGLIGKGIVIA